MDQDQLALLPLWYAVFLLSVTCHEAAHAWAAYRGGDDTAYRGGQVSLNPLPHVRREPFGSVLVPLLSFMNMGWMMGWASAPYDPLWEDRYPRRAAWMAAAGPLTNLLLAVLGFAVLKAGLLSGTWQVPVSDHYELDRLVVPGATAAAGLGGLGRFFSILLSLNVVLFLFNLLPLPKPGFRRTINLIARSGELGELPHQVAAVCCEVIAGVFVPKILELAPWLKGQLEIGEVA